MAAEDQAAVAEDPTDRDRPGGGGYGGSGAEETATVEVLVAAVIGKR
jgi:hypothetical protein